MKDRTNNRSNLAMRFAPHHVQKSRRAGRERLATAARRAGRAARLAGREGTCDGGGCDGGQGVRRRRESGQDVRRQRAGRAAAAHAIGKADDAWWRGWVVRWPVHGQVVREQFMTCGRLFFGRGSEYDEHLIIGWF